MTGAPVVLLAAGALGWYNLTMMMTTNTKPASHTDCAHDATKAARAACRKARKAAQLIEAATVDACMVALGTWNASDHDCSQYPLDDDDRCTGCGQLPEGF